MRHITTDENLMMAYRDGDSRAFENLYQRHKGPLYRYLLRQCRVAAIAEELFQDVWMSLIKARERYEPRAKFTTYLYRVAHNHLIDHYRRQSSGVPPSYTEEPDDLSSDASQWGTLREPVTKGDAGAYTFIVKIEGFGIDRAPYGDWWEVLSEDGRLLYRGILSPGDIKERSYAGVGGPIPIEANTTVWVLTHTSSAGYGPMGFKGSPRTGFRKTEMPVEFAAKVGGQIGLGLRATPAR